MAEMVQRVADAIEANIPGTVAWVFSAAAIDQGEVNQESSAIELFFAKAKESLKP